MNVSFACTVALTAIGYIVIEPKRPIPEPGATAADTMQQDGIPS